MHYTMAGCMSISAFIHVVSCEASACQYAAASEPEEAQGVGFGNE